MTDTAKLIVSDLQIQAARDEATEIIIDTNLTPRQLLEQRDQAIADQIRLMNLLESAAFFLKQALTIETRTPLVDNNDPDKNHYVYQGCLNRLRIELARRQSALAKGGKVGG